MARRDVGRCRWNLGSCLPRLRGCLFNVNAKAVFLAVEAFLGPVWDVMACGRLFCPTGKYGPLMALCLFWYNLQPL